MSKHTPGPWFFGHYGCDQLWVGPDHLQNPVAIVPHDMNCDARDESRENAALIAAAPELLAALKALVSARNAGHYHGEWDDARAAIAKAEGKQ